MDLSTDAYLIIYQGLNKSLTVISTNIKTFKYTKISFINTQFKYYLVIKLIKIYTPLIFPPMFNFHLPISLNMLTFPLPLTKFQKKNCFAHYYLTETNKKPEENGGYLFYWEGALNHDTNTRFDINYA